MDSTNPLNFANTVPAEMAVENEVKKNWIDANIHMCCILSTIYALNMRMLSRLGGLDFKDKS